MNYEVDQTVILNNEQRVRIIAVDEENGKYIGRDEETYEEVVFVESRILVSY